MPLVDPVAVPAVDPAGEIADEPGEFEPDTFELGTFNGSEAQPGEVTAPLTDVPVTAPTGHERPEILDRGSRGRNWRERFALVCGGSRMEWLQARPRV
jgi:hypothetical protein